MKINTELVRELRTQHGLSQEALAEAAGLSARTVQRLENGKPASNESVMALAAVFDTDPASLEDTSLEQGRLVRRLERGYRFGMAGILVGAACAILGIALDFVRGGVSATQAGLLLGAIGLATGLVSAVLGRWTDHRRREAGPEFTPAVPASGTRDDD